MFTDHALATTRAAEGGQPALNICQVRAEFLQPEVTRTNLERSGRNLNVDSVYWKVEIEEISNKDICPPLGIRKIRLRGASFRGSPSAPEITYAVEIAEPPKGRRVELRLEFSKGQDTFTKAHFEEWLLKELVGE